MRRREALAFVAAGALAVGGGVTWLFGAWGLIGWGSVAAIGGLLLNVSEDKGEEGQ